MDVVTKTDIKQDETKESIKEKECQRQRNTRKKAKLQEINLIGRKS
jgi:hypothetical protein